MYRVGLQQDGHSSEQPFPQFDILQFVDGLEDLLDSDGDTATPAPTAPTQSTESTETDRSDHIQATSSAKHPENTVLIPTAASGTVSPQANPSTTKGQGLVQHELLCHFANMLIL